MLTARNESHGHKNLTAWCSRICGRLRSDSWRRPWQLQDEYFESQLTLNRVAKQMEACTRNYANSVTYDTVN